MFKLANPSSDKKIIASFDYIKELLLKNEGIKGVTLREYNYPASKPGTPPAKGDTLTFYERDKFLGLNLEELISNLPSNRNTGIESMVLLTSGERAHIAMLDFRSSYFKPSLSKIKLLLSKFIVPKFGHGGIFLTNSSYHFIGNGRLLSQKEFDEFLKWSLVLSYKKLLKYRPIVDAAYVGYSLLKGSACLRITPYPKHKLIPHLIDTV